MNRGGSRLRCAKRRLARTIQPATSAADLRQVAGTAIAHDGDAAASGMRHAGADSRGAARALTGT